MKRLVLLLAVISSLTYSAKAGDTRIIPSTYEIQGKLKSEGIFTIEGRTVDIELGDITYGEKKVGKIKGCLARVKTSIKFNSPRVMLDNAQLVCGSVKRDIKILMMDSRDMSGGIRADAVTDKRSGAPALKIDGMVKVILVVYEAIDIDPSLDPYIEIRARKYKP